MDEFDIDLDNTENIGTSISKLNETNDKREYIENFKNNLENEKLRTRPKKHINMDKIIRNIEMDIINNDDYKETQDTEKISEVKIVEKTKEIKTSMMDYINKDILIYMLIFMLLNNKFIIEFIYDKIPGVKKFDSTYPNLLIRSFIFGLSIYLIRKFM